MFFVKFDLSSSKKYRSSVFVATENAQDYDRGDTNVNRMANDLPTDF